MNKIKFFFNYFKNYQTPLIRYLHFILMFALILEIPFGYLMEISLEGEISNQTLEFYSSWIHIIFGLILVPILLLFFIVMFKKNGLKYYFPYLFNIKYQISKDIKRLKDLNFPNIKPYGIVACVEGLGFLVLLMSLLSGVCWFVFWQNSLPYTNIIKDIHNISVIFVEVFIFGHGVMGLLYIFFNSLKS